MHPQLSPPQQPFVAHPAVPRLPRPHPLGSAQRAHTCAEATPSSGTRLLRRGRGSDEGPGVRMQDRFGRRSPRGGARPPGRPCPCPLPWTRPGGAA
jgi:hypothetical protein